MGLPAFGKTVTELPEEPRALIAAASDARGVAPAARADWLRA